MLDIRNRALKAVDRTLYSGGFSNRIVDEFCKDMTEAWDRAFFTKLYMGTLENVLLLDKVIDYLTNGRIKRIERPVLGILRLSLYQVLFMDSVPDPAAVSEAQILCDKNKLKRAKGFVNGVLRNAVRKRENLVESALCKLPPEEKEALMGSLPYFLYEYLVESVGDGEIKSLINNIKGDHFLSLRIRNTIEMDRAIKIYEEGGFSFERIPNLPAIRFLESVPNSVIPGIKEGFAYIQDISSMEAVAALKIKSGDRVLDLCAAPGGKGLYAAELAHPGQVIMRDISEKKINIIRNNAKNLGIENVTIAKGDALEFDGTLEGQMDIVIGDLPCSGLGTIGNKPEIKYRINIEDIEEIGGLQRRMLDIGARYVKPGGKLLFSTCTLSRIENDDNADWFVKNHGEFQEIIRRSLLPDGKGSDGFFYCVFQKKPKGTGANG